MLPEKTKQNFMDKKINHTKHQETNIVSFNEEKKKSAVKKDELSHIRFNFLIDLN